MEIRTEKKLVEKVVTLYVAEDGKEFETEKACQQNVIKKSWTWEKLTEEEQKRFTDMNVFDRIKGMMIQGWNG